MIATEIAAYLTANGYTTSSAVTVDYQPDSPDNLLTLHNESAPVLPESHALAVDLCGLQVLVRNESNSAARAKAIAIHKELVGLSGVLSGQSVTDFYVVTSPAPIGRDSKNRAEWSAHYSYRLLSTGDKQRS
jgi:hypothetical protein